jgi:hypothetical protein
MSDNTTIQSPSTPGDVISTEDVSGVKIPRNKIVLGAHGVDGGDVTTSNPFPTAPQAGEIHIGEVGTPCDVISVTPTISTSPAYSSGDAVGGVQTLTSAVRVSSGVAILESLTVIDKGNQKAALTLLFFNANPAAATVTDNSTFVFSTDISKLIGKVNVLASDYETVNSIGIASVKAIGLETKASGSANLFVAVVTTGTPTYLTTSDLSFQYGFLQK